MNVRRGSGHPRWNNRIISDHGYAKVRVGVGHPLADPKGYAYEHDLVAVTALGRPLGPDELVHHRNDDKLDNRIDNLVVETRSDHASRHIADMRRDRRGRVVGKKKMPPGRSRSAGAVRERIIDQPQNRKRVG